jgi:hypothetical protein
MPKWRITSKFSVPVWGATATCVAMVVSCIALAQATPEAQEHQQLRPPSAFSDVSDRAARSRALFAEAAKVITSPRCMNCHPAGDHPTQGNDEHVHQPAAFRGEAGVGVPGLPCASCHNEKNFPLAVGAASYQSIPGHPRWGLAPIEMAWQGKTPADICRQIKDPARNGGRDLATLQEHLAKDDLVGWAWHPGPGRRPAPGSQQEFGAIVAAWIDSGAECPG